MDSGEMNMNQTQDDVLFLTLIQNLHVSTFIHLGKIKDPLADEVSVNLEAARGSIDMLRMIATKTKGNLTHREEQMLEHVLFEAQMNFVDEVEKAKNAPKTEGEQPPGQSEKTEAGDRGAQSDESNEMDGASDQS